MDELSDVFSLDETKLTKSTPIENVDCLRQISTVSRLAINLLIRPEYYLSLTAEEVIVSEYLIFWDRKGSRSCTP